jgi:hypothetical protein
MGNTSQGQVPALSAKISFSELEKTYFSWLTEEKQGNQLFIV